MKKIEKYEEIIKAEEDTNLKEAGVNPTLYWAYRNLEESGNELIDFDECIWEEDVEDITKELKEYGIEEFTISSGYSKLVGTLAAFDKAGVKMNGMTEVNTTYKDYRTGEMRKTPAIKMIIK